MTKPDTTSPADSVDEQASLTDLRHQTIEGVMVAVAFALGAILGLAPNTLLN
ncbi:MAG: hypothetical protein HWE26_17000 [Alteromonadaceae bacterium]|nr:hypothetical protein [Alteromonadaceae bacterium]